MNRRPPPWPPPPGGWPMPPPYGMPPGMPPPGAPQPRKKPGEGDDPPRKGRCLVREDNDYEAPNATKSLPKPGSAPKPARELKSDREPDRPRPARTSHSSDYQLINGLRVGRKFFWVTAGAFALILLAVLSIPLVIMLQAPQYVAANKPIEQSTDEGDTETETNVGSHSVQTAPLRDRLKEIRAAAIKQIDDPASTLEQLLKENAERTGMAQLRTISFEGVSHANDKEYDVNVFIKSPNQVRQVLEFEDTKITCVFDGNYGKLDLKNYVNGRESSRELTRAQNLALMMSCIPNWPLWQEGSDQSLLADGGQETVDGQIYSVIINRSVPGQEIHHFYDEDGIERLRRAELQENDIIMAIDAQFKQYSWQGSYFVPMEIVIKERGHIPMSTQIDIEKWEFNKGLLPSLFVIGDH